MTDKLSKELRAAFDAIGAIDEQTAAELDAAEKATRRMIDHLELKFKDRGLKFTSPFHGGMPVQAYGHIDGMRFYFRFRHNWANLRVGPYDQEIEDLDYKWTKVQGERVVAKSRAKFEAGEIDQRRLDHDIKYWLTTTPERRQFEDSPEFYPTRIVKSAGRKGFPDGTGWESVLNDDEAFEIFSDLVENLEDIPEDEQINEYTKRWLAGGPEALEAYQKEQETRIRAEMEAEKAESE